MRDVHLMLRKLCCELKERGISAAHDAVRAVKALTKGGQQASVDHWLRLRDEAMRPLTEVARAEGLLAQEELQAQVHVAQALGRSPCANPACPTLPPTTGEAKRVRACSGC